MPGRAPTAPHGRPSRLPHARLRSGGGASAVRAVAAAVLAVAALVTAANAVPAHATQPAPASSSAPDRARDE
ncbi:hypothetical protein ACH4F6_22475 [Streptomyces sp. NPDC017936]|uniref:hypothetical protein n=1 Tax=Streptomyces sp. NPDC017936 TaxID=3365016 RepID=UPI0037A67474